MASGDYKLEDDGLTEAFEPVKCHTFITKSTFGLPVYNWKPQAEVFEEIKNCWYAKCERREGQPFILLFPGKSTAYSLRFGYFYWAHFYTWNDRKYQ